VYEKLLKINKNDLEALPSLIIAYSAFDSQQAEKLSARLPELVGQRSIDVEKLENVMPRFGARTIKEEVIVKKSEEENKIKKKKKRKNKPPKDLSKPIDPERWIPLKQRSYYKRKQRKGKLEKGSQGGVSVGRSVQAEKGKTTTDNKAIEKPTPTSPIVDRKQEVEGEAQQNKVEAQQNKPKVQPSSNTKKKQQKKKRR